MARLSDEARELLEENREKKITARGARNRRGHTGKGGAVVLPSDNLTRKQLEAMNGKCETYYLGKPMIWLDFKRMPDDLKIEYIKKLRAKYSVPDAALAKVMGVSESTFGKCIRELNLGQGRAASVAGRKWYGTESCSQFVNFWCSITGPEKHGKITVEGDATKTLYELAKKLEGTDVKLTVEWNVMEK